MENKLHNKEKFFAQYWGQEVFCEKETESKDSFTTYAVMYREPVNHNSLCYIDSKSYLELKSLKKVSDEDAIVLGKYRYREPKMLTHLEIGKSLINEFFTSPKTKIEHFEADYLRSKGYALPFIGLSVEMMIAYGWIKLIS